jgi:hypothetical protein
MLHTLSFYDVLQLWDMEADTGEPMYDSELVRMPREIPDDNVLSGNPSPLPRPCCCSAGRTINPFTRRVRMGSELGNALITLIQ